MPVNPRIPLPRPPHRRVSYFDCECGEDYDRFNSRTSFREGQCE